MTHKNAFHTIGLCAVLAGLVVGCTKENLDADPGKVVNKAVAEAFDAQGVSTGLFAVSESSYIRFSRGNLQYQASTDTWRFAPKQTDCLLLANEQISPDNDGWIDLFGWGTSGWNSGATCYRPYDNDPTPSFYTPYGAPTADLDGSWADWGRYITLAEGHNINWRTLSQAEWTYLFGSSTDEQYGRANLWGLATIGAAEGAILIPNRRVAPNGKTYLWKLPKGLTFTPGQDSSWLTNTYSADEWALLEQTGAVFLPAARFRTSTVDLNGEGFLSTVVNVDDGYYWSSTHVTASSAAMCRLRATKKVSFYNRSAGLSVRLVTNHSH